ncbi:MAG: HAD-IIB family hydrolase [Clostridiales bacterium]|nr:HAD-IIB family hydrolase [Clostridiales bacterium]
MQSDFSKIKAVAFDLDSTILNDDKVLSERTRHTLTKIYEKGIALIPVSGRAYATFPACIRDQDGIRYAVTSNGAAIYDIRTEERVHQCLLRAADVRTIMRSVGNFFLEGQITYEAFVDGTAYASADYVQNPARFGVSLDNVSYVRQTRKPNRYIIDFIFEHAKVLDSLDLVLKDAGLYRMIENTIRRSVPDVHITSAVPYRIEISHADANKASGLSHALKLLQIAPEECLALGDGDNDAPMLTCAGIGVALKNATETCKNSADHVTEYSSSEDGASIFLEKYLL